MARGLGERADRGRNGQQGSHEMNISATEMFAHVSAGSITDTFAIGRAAPVAPSHIHEMKREHAQIASLSDQSATSQSSDDLPMLDTDVSTASGTDSVDGACEDMKWMSAAPPTEPANESENDLALAAAAQPPSELAQRLSLQNFMAGGEMEYDAVQEWLHDSNTPWSVHTMTYRDSKSQHIHTLEEMLSRCDRVMSPSGAHNGASQLLQW
ncbi:hypothetical protein LTR85_003282 [Meristemomyces frigidus]|nr:hypothetical protein LTR85_003282 [Meristemomyces frigidus]